MPPPMSKRLQLPITQWLPNYSKQWLGADAAAGLTVGIMLIPQGMAYAMIAGLPPVYGLYAALIPQVVYAFLGTSRQLSVGPVAMDSLLVASGLGALSLSSTEDYIQMALFLALFMGSLQFIFGLVRLGFFVNFLAKPVISGFTSAAAIIIGMSQLKYVLGIDIPRSNKLHEQLWNTWNLWEETHITSLVICIGAILSILLLKRFFSKFPAALGVTVLGILASYFFQWDQLGVSVVREIPSGLPSFQLPSFDYSAVQKLFPIALTLALIAFMEAISVAKAIEEKHKETTVLPNQELIALGMANIIGALFQSYPTSGGFSRTAVNDQAGAKSQMSSIISASVIALTLVFFTPYFYYLPTAILAAIIIIAVSGLIDWSYPLALYKTRKDEFLLWLFTAAVTLSVGITQGIVAGVFVALILVIYRSSVPHIAILGRIKNTNYYRNINRFQGEVEDPAGIVIFRFDSQLFFGNQAYFKQALWKAIEERKIPTQGVLFNLESVTHIDSTALFMLDDLIEKLQEKNIRTAMAGAIGPVRDILQQSPVWNHLGTEAFFENTHSAYLWLNESIIPPSIESKIALESNTKTT